MEPMEYDSSPRGYRSSRSLPSPSASPPVSPLGNPDVKSDVSDMEIDQNSSPLVSKSTNTSVRPSSSLDFVKSSLDDILSFKKDSSFGEKRFDTAVNQSSQSKSGAVRGCQSVPPFMSLMSQNASNNLVSNFMAGRPKTSCAAVAPTVQEKKKTGYGLVESGNDLMFSHFPNSHSPSKKVVQKYLRNRSAKSNGTFPEKLSKVNMLKRGKEKKNQGTSKRIMVMLFYIVIGLYTLFLLAQFLLGRRVCGRQNFFQSKVLEIDLKSELFGQHIASELISKHLNNYFTNEFFKSKGSSDKLSSSSSQSETQSQPACRPLVLSFHGWTGVGKNFASHIISQAFTNVNIHLSIIPLLFPHINSQSLYGQQIEDWIKSNRTDCSVNLFIIDEMDKAFPEVQKGLLRTIQSMGESCSVSAPVVFVIISNTHAALINQVFVQKFHHLSLSDRLEIKPEDFYSVFRSPEEDEWYKDFSSAGVIDAFIPFLPLERRHVIDCIKRDLISKHFSTEDEVVSQVLDELSFTRQGELDLSTTGCKRVSEKVDFVIYSK